MARRRNHSAPEAKPLLTVHSVHCQKCKKENPREHRFCRFCKHIINPDAPEVESENCSHNAVPDAQHSLLRYNFCPQCGLDMRTGMIGFFSVAF